MTTRSVAPRRLASWLTSARIGTRAPVVTSNTTRASPPSAGSVAGSIAVGSSKMIGESGENPSAPPNASSIDPPGPSWSSTRAGRTSWGTSRWTPVAVDGSATIQRSDGNGSRQLSTDWSVHGAPVARAERASAPTGAAATAIDVAATAIASTFRTHVPHRHVHPPPPLDRRF